MPSPNICRNCRNWNSKPQGAIVNDLKGTALQARPVFAGYCTLNAPVMATEITSPRWPITDGNTDYCGSFAVIIQ